MRMRTLLPLVVFVAAVCLGILVLNLLQGESNLIEVTLDKETYHYGENMVYTVKNNTSIVILLSGSPIKYFEKWVGENGSWILDSSVGSAPVFYSIQPGESHQSSCNIGMFLSSSGKYRAVIMASIFDENYSLISTYYAYPEFTYNV